MIYIVVGLGGTGGYLVNNLVKYLNIYKNKEMELVLVDGDVLEERNLLRQGFLPKDIGRNKAEVLSERFGKVVKENIKLSYRGTYIDKISDVEEIVGNKKDVVIISCVDNNMARYRLIMSQYKMHEDGLREITFLDAGNEEWHGQVLVNRLRKGYKSPVAYKDGVFEFKGNVKGHNLSTIFDSREDWINTLGRADYELSCDVVAAAAPQNIVTNMTSAAGLMYMLNKVFSKGYENVRYQFDIKKGIQEELKIEENIDRVRELVEFANGEGNRDLFIGGRGDEVYGEGLQELVEDEEVEEDTGIELREQEPHLDDSLLRSLGIDI